ncbi:MAG: winged helix-turn-helix domain-containing protein [Candidatus Bathyarchaeia archaeon]
MRRKRRDRLTIMAQILNIAREGISKTRIMYGAGLSFDQLNGYLSSLQEADLLKISINNGTEICKTTPKGVKYLQTFSQLKACIQAAGAFKTAGSLPKFSVSKQRHVFIIDN